MLMNHAGGILRYKCQLILEQEYHSDLLPNQNQSAMKIKIEITRREKKGNKYHVYKDKKNQSNIYNIEYYNLIIRAYKPYSFCNLIIIGHHEVFLK